MTQTEWSEAEQSVVHIAEDMIDHYHCHLKDIDIGFLFRDKASVSKGKGVFAGVQLVPAKLKPLLDYDVIIWVSQDYWNMISAAQRKALIDHQLCHIFKGENSLKLVGHDVEEFNSVIVRHGLWNPSLSVIGNAVRKAVQGNLFEDTEKKSGVVAVISSREAAVLEQAATALVEQ